MQMRARVDVDSTGLGDTGAGGEQRAGQVDGGSWGLDCGPEFSSTWGLKGALGLRERVSKMGLRSLHPP